MEGGAGVEVCLGLAQGLLEALGGVATRHGATARTGAVVPADGDVGVVGDGELALQFLPLGIGRGEDGGVVIIDVDEMAELIVRHAVESELADEAVAGTIGLCGIEAAVVELGLPHGELQLKVGEAGALNLLAEPAEGIRGLLNPAQPLDEGGDLVDHEDGLAVDLIIIGLAEEQLDVAAAHLLEGLAADAPTPDDVALAEMGDARVPVVLHVVVGPHEVELHLVAVAGTEEAVGERRLHEGALVEPVPVEDEDVDAMAGGLLNLHLHHGRVGLVDVAPQRMAVPVMAGVALLHGHHGLPLAHAQGPEGAEARVVSRIGRIEIRRHVVRFPGLCNGHRGGQ